LKRRIKKIMQTLMNKTKATAVMTIVLFMASVALIAVSQPVQAQTPDELNIPHGGNPAGLYGYPNLGPLPTGVTPAYTIETVAYMSITPNPIGVGQQILVNIWTSPGQYHSFYMQGYKVTFQKPDGTTVVIGPMTSYLGDDTAWFQYVVDQVGTWKAKFEQPGTYLPVGIYVDRPGTPGANYTLGASVLYTASSTDWQEFTVQQDWVNSWPSVPIPTDYWTRPISAENREWWSISGWYPWSGIYYYPNGRMLYPSNYRFTAYVQAPNTAHVVWRRQGNIGGLIGADAYQYSAFTGGGTPEIIYAGRCYDTVTKPMLTLVNGTYRTLPTSVWECYDLRTGQVYWDLTDVTAPTSVLVEPPTVQITEQMAASAGYSISLAVITNPSGTNPGRLIKYNPFTGAVTSNVTCLPTGVTAQRPGIVSPGGEYGSYFFNDTYSYAIQNFGTSVPAEQRYRLIKWDAKGTSSNFTTRILSNITWPRSSLGAVDFEAGIAIVGNWAVPPGPQWCIGYNNTATDLNTGVNLWNYATNDTLHDNAQTLSSPVVDRGRFAMAMQQRHWDCWDARTGKKLWESELTEYPWGNWWPYATASYDFNESKGAIITGSYAGVYAFDWDTGKILWHYADQDVPFESPYGNTPFQSGVRIADGKIYAYNTEHTTSQPITRGWRLYCINATNGELLWKITGPMSPGAVADGYLTASNPYDGYMYVFGKGKSETTVSAPDTAVAKGTAVLIHGTVMDMSPGDQGSFTNPTARLDSPTAPGKVPCVSAASMETEMEYLYMQHPQDGLYHNVTVTGVPVLLMAFDSNNNYITIGTATSDVSGSFQYAWTPPDEGVYKITATFAGDDSYGSSWTETGVTVGPAPATPTPTPEQPQAQPDNTPLIYATLAIIVAIVIVGLLIILALRKRQ
jgi:hypothetical protein